MYTPDFKFPLYDVNSATGAFNDGMPLTDYQLELHLLLYHDHTMDLYGMMDDANNHPLKHVNIRHYVSPFSEGRDNDAPKTLHKRHKLQFDDQNMCLAGQSPVDQIQPRRHTLHGSGPLLPPIRDEIWFALTSSRVAAVTSCATPTEPLASIYTNAIYESEKALMVTMCTFASF